MLFSQGADVNRMHGTLKPLHCACMVADADCVELLLEKGAEVQRNKNHSLSLQTKVNSLNSVL